MAWGNVGVLETAATMTTATMAITKPVIYMEGWGSKKWIQVVVGRWKGGCINMCLCVCVCVCVCPLVCLNARTYARVCVYKQYII